MKFKTQLILGLLVILLTISCVYAEDDITTTNHNITEDTYSTYFNNDGTLKTDSGIESGDILNLGNLTDKQLIINTSINIQKLDDDSILENTGIMLLTGSQNSNISGLTFIQSNNIVSLINYASNTIIKDNIFFSEDDGLVAILSAYNENTNIINNTILFNKTNTYMAITVQESNKTSIKNNKIEGTNPNESVGIILNSGNDNIIDNNTILVNTSSLLAIALYNQNNSLIVNNTINSTNGNIVGISLLNTQNSIIIENEIDSTSGSTDESCGIFNIGENNLITRNIVEGTNLNGIITLSNNTDIIFNLITLTSDENIYKTNNTSQLTGISAVSSNNQLNENVIILLEGSADFTYGIHIFKESNEELTNNTINFNQIYIDSLSPEVAGIYVNDLDNCIIDSNLVFVQSDGMIYGVSSHPIEEDETYNYTISDNIIIGNGNDVRLIEILSAVNYNITNNNLTGEGEGIYGIVGENVTNTTINNNTINVTGKNTSNAKGNDPIKPGNSAITIKGDSKKDTIVDNTLVSNNNITIDNSTEDIIVENNTQEISTQILVNDTIIIENTGSNFTGKLLTINGNPIVGHHLSINLTRLSNGLFKVYDLVSDYNGEFSIPINLAKGDYSAKLSYNGLELNNNIYSPSESDTVNIKVVKEYDNRTETIITANPLTKTYNTDVNFTGTLKDTNNNNVIGHHLNLKLTRLSSGASKTYDVVTDYTGLFKIPINLAPGAYTAEISYDGTSQYQPTNTNTISITVLP